MSKERELLKQAEELIHTISVMASIDGVRIPTNIGIALRLEIQGVLAQPEQPEHVEDKLAMVEPAAWMYDHHIEVGHDKYTEFNVVVNIDTYLSDNVPTGSLSAVVEVRTPPQTTSVSHITFSGVPAVGTQIKNKAEKFSK